MSRIIAGAVRGCRLATPDGSNTRPTSDRVREALFSALTSWAGGADADPADSLRGLAFLDLYAGSGAVGLEAASRGAGPVWLVEHDRKTADLIRRNTAELRLPATVQAQKVETFLAGAPPQPFDVIWADPPYRLESAVLDDHLRTLVDGGWLVRNGLVVLERAKRDPAPDWPSELDDTWSRRYGETTLYFGQRGDFDFGQRGEPDDAADPNPAPNSAKEAPR